MAARGGAHATGADVEQPHRAVTTAECDHAERRAQLGDRGGEWETSLGAKGGGVADRRGAGPEAVGDQLRSGEAEEPRVARHRDPAAWTSSRRWVRWGRRRPVRASMRQTSLPASVSAACTRSSRRVGREDRALAPARGRCTSSVVRRAAVFAGRRARRMPPWASRTPAAARRLPSGAEANGPPSVPDGRPDVTPSRRRVAGSRNATAPLKSLTASAPPPGGRSIATSEEIPGRITPMAAGLRRNAARRLAWVCGPSSSATPWRASSNERSSVSAFSACAPSRCASAALGLRSRLPRWSSASSAAAGGERRAARATPASDELDPAPGALARDAARIEELLLGRVELRLVRGAPLERGGEPRAAVELAAIPVVGVPLPRRMRSGGRGGAGPRRPPRASRAGAAIRAGAPRAPPRPCPR